MDRDGARVLHVDPNPDAHRTVITLAGEHEAVCEALFWGVAAAQELIDMRRHRGEHIRIGAADVVPLIALGTGNPGPALDALAIRIADQLEIPLFLYEDSARRPAFSSLPRCRRGGYEALPTRFSLASDGPDLGPERWGPKVARSGATAIGVRGVLVAMNFTLDSDDRSLAEEIAAAIRTNGPEGRPNRLERVRAVGWVMDAYAGRAQVSVNLLDPRISSAHDVLATVRRLAGPVEVLGAELIGLTPARVLADAGRDARGLPKKGWPAEQVLDGPASSQEDLLLLGCQALGLDHLNREQGMGGSSLARVLERQLMEAGLPLG
jgi:glutamate formiminotransferase